MTNSVTKSFLSTVVGLAVDHGLIRSVQDTVENYMAPIEVYHSWERTSDEMSQGSDLGRDGYENSGTSAVIL
jgi:CubicO group peptidase (beta-lactamase class C family)